MSRARAEIARASRAPVWRGSWTKSSRLFVGDEGSFADRRRLLVPPPRAIDRASSHRHVRRPRWEATESHSDALKVSVDIRNTGDRAGREVVQVYASRPQPVVERPPNRLVGFTSVTINAGETRRVEIVIDPRAFRHWDDSLSRWRTELGDCVLHAGRSVADLRVSTTVRVPEGTPASPDASSPRPSGALRLTSTSSTRGRFTADRQETRREN